MRSIHSRKAIDKSRKAFERAQTQTKRDEAKVTELQAALHAAETNLSYTDIVSPSRWNSGLAQRRKRSVGHGGLTDATALRHRRGSRPSFTSTSIIAAKDSGEVKPGDKAAITVEALRNREFQGEVIQIRPAHTNENGAAYEVEIKVPNPDLLLKPGMAVTVRIMTE